MILFNFVICDSHGGYTVKEGLFIMHNLDLFQAFTPEYYGFPDVPPCSLVDSSDFLPFNFRDKKSDCLDFFCDDRFFECVWKNPLGYVVFLLVMLFSFKNIRDFFVFCGFCVIFAA